MNKFTCPQKKFMILNTYLWKCWKHEYLYYRARAKVTAIYIYAKRVNSDKANTAATTDDPDSINEFIDRVINDRCRHRGANNGDTTA